MVRSSFETLRLQRRRDLARLARERVVEGAAPAQALYQADAGGLGIGVPAALGAGRASASAGRVTTLTFHPVEVGCHPRYDAAEGGEVARGNAVFRLIRDAPRHRQQFVAQPLGLGGEQ